MNASLILFIAAILLFVTAVILFFAGVTLPGYLAVALGCTLMFIWVIVRSNQIHK